MDHNWYKNSLSAWLDQELDPTEQHWIKEHLEECSDCQLEVARLTALHTKLRKLPTHEPSTLLRSNIMDVVEGRSRLRKPVTFRLVAQPIMAVLILSLAVYVTTKSNSGYQTVGQSEQNIEMDKPLPGPVADMIKLAPPAKQKLAKQSIPQLRKDVARPMNLTFRAVPEESTKENKNDVGTVDGKAISGKIASRLESVPLTENKKLSITTNPAVQPLTGRVDNQPEIIASAPKLVSIEESNHLASSIESDKAVLSEDSLQSMVGGRAPASSQKKMSRSSSTVSAAPKRTEDGFFLPKSAYQKVVQQEMLLHIDHQIYGDVSKCFRGDGIDFLESRLDDYYEIQLKIPTNRWQEVLLKLQKKFEVNQTIQDGINVTTLRSLQKETLK